jgi:hypothetical protein
MPDILLLMYGDWVIVYSGSIVDADLLRCLLDREGIESMLQDEVMGNLAAPYIAPGGAGAVKVAVRRNDVTRARRLVDDFAEQ